MSARSDGETLAVTDAVVVAEGVGDAVGACANEPVVSVIEAMQTITDIFIAVLWQ